MTKRIFKKSLLHRDSPQTVRYLQVSEDGGGSKLEDQELSRVVHQETDRVLVSSDLTLIDGNCELGE